MVAKEDSFCKTRDKDLKKVYFLIRYTQTKITLFTDQHYSLITLQILKVQQKIYIVQSNTKCSRLSLVKACQTQCRVPFLTLDIPPLSRYGLKRVDMGGRGGPLQYKITIEL